MNHFTKGTSMARKTILIAEDEQVQRESMAAMLIDEGYQVLQAGDGKEAYDLVLRQPVDVVLSDLRMPRMDGMALLEHMQMLAPETPVIILTAYGTIPNTVGAMRAGAVDYLLKPVQFHDLLRRIRRALDRREVRHSRQVMTEQLSTASSFHNLVGQTRSMQRLFETVRKLSAVKSNVLITGESGTGKDLFAQAIHYNGLTRDRPFVAVNSAGIPSSLVESELFGHRQGAFTGATRDKVGYFEAAHGGTLFLDEISGLPPVVQCSLLRALETKMIVPVGDTRPRAVDVRIIAASNRDLSEMVAAGEFRLDLLHRLNVVTLELPPLRHRTEDIPLLVQHFLDKYTREMNKRVESVSNDAMRALLNYDWLGNVRELANVIEHAIIFADGDQIVPSNLPFTSDDAPGEAHGVEDLKEAIARYERQYITNSLGRHEGNKTETAKSLGISLSTFYRKLETMDLPCDSDQNDDQADAGVEEPWNDGAGVLAGSRDGGLQGMRASKPADGFVESSRSLEPIVPRGK